jgi:hypothetical protein
MKPEVGNVYRGARGDLFVAARLNADGKIIYHYLGDQSMQDSWHYATPEAERADVVEFVRVATAEDLGSPCPSTPEGG